MRTEILNQEKNRITIKAEIPAEEFQAKINNTVFEMSKKVSVKGFRKGKVPRHVLEMKFGKEAIYSETLDSMLPVMMDEIVNDYELALISQPKLDIKKLVEGEPLELEFVFETAPQVQLPDLSVIEVEKLRAEVTTEMIDEAIKHISESNGSNVEVTDRNKTESDDILNIQYSTEIIDPDSEKVNETEPSETTIDLAQEGLDDKIKEALTERETGENVQVETVIDGNVEDKTLEGKTARHKIRINGIMKKEPAEINSEFFKKISGRDMDSEEEFREFVKEQLTQRMEQESLNAAQNSALNKIVELSEMEIPESMVSKQVEDLKKTDEENIQKKFNKSLPEFLEESSMTEEEYQNTLQKRAEESVGHYLVVDAIAKQEQIYVTDEDVDMEIANIAQMYGMDSNTVKASLFKEESRLDELKNEIRYRKIMNVLTENVKLNEVDKLSSDDNDEAENTDE